MEITSTNNAMLLLSLFDYLTCVVVAMVLCVCSNKTEIRALSCQLKDATEELKQLLNLLTKFIESLHVSVEYISVWPTVCQ